MLLPETLRSAQKTVALLGASHPAPIPLQGQSVPAPGDPGIRDVARGAGENDQPGYHAPGEPELGEDLRDRIRARGEGRARNQREAVEVVRWYAEGRQEALSRFGLAGREPKGASGVMIPSASHPHDTLR